MPILHKEGQHKSNQRKIKEINYYGKQAGCKNFPLIYGQRILLLEKIQHSAPPVRLVCPMAALGRRAWARLLISAQARVIMRCRQAARRAPAASCSIWYRAALRWLRWVCHLAFAAPSRATVAVAAVFGECVGECRRAQHELGRSGVRPMGVVHELVGHQALIVDVHAQVVRDILALESSRTRRVARLRGGAAGERRG